MASAADLVPIIASKFAAVDPEKLAAVISIATLQVGTVFGDKRQLGIAYLAAHMLEIDPEVGGSSSGTGGTVTMEKEGELMRAYAATPSGRANDAAYNRTIWGQEFIRIRNQCVMSPRTRAPVVIDNDYD